MLKLNLGCGDAHREGFVNVDCCQPADVITDLEFDWPWSGYSVDYILAVDIIEHLPNPIWTMNEMYRVLRPGGIAEIEVPTTNGECAFADPTHVSFWNRRSFFYYTDGHPYRERYGKAYGIEARFKVESEYIRNMADGPKLLIKLVKV